MSDHQPFAADGHRAAWSRVDGTGHEELALTWENEGWTASGLLGAERAQYVVRLSPTWQPRQFLLFRDLDEPDLWLATDGAGRWGEINGARRADLDGCTDLGLDASPFPLTVPMRRLPLHEGDAATITVAVVDIDLLAVRPEHQRLTRLGGRTWRWERLEPGEVHELEVDDHGLVLDLPGRFTRLPAPA